jgi:hypothetical protein
MTKQTRRGNVGGFRFSKFEESLAVALYFNTGNQSAAERTISAWRDGPFRL